MIEPGLIIFIKKKLEQAISPVEIEKMLFKAGFSKSIVREAFDIVHISYKDTHQDIVASNNFLPPLFKTSSKSPSKTFSGSSSKILRGMFAGRLSRHDFNISFLYFGLYVSLCVVFLYAGLRVLAPELLGLVQEVIFQDTFGGNFLVLPILFVPLTLYVVSLIGRRFQDIGLPPDLSFLFLLIFINPQSELGQLGYWGMHVALLILLILLVVRKGEHKANEYGEVPTVNKVNGATFARVYRDILS